MYGDCVNPASGSSINGYDNTGANCASDYDDPQSCYTCVKNGIPDTLKRSCNSETADTVKRIIREQLGGSYSRFVAPVTDALDQERLPPLGYQGIGQACENCVREIGKYLQRQTCSCDNLGWGAGLELDRVDALSSCSSAGGGGGQSYGGQGSASDPPTKCSDIPASWIDTAKNGCEHYEEMKYCTSSGGYGPGWLEQKGTFSDWAFGEVSATEACCACGGGSAALANAAPPAAGAPPWAPAISAALLSAMLSSHLGR